MVLSMYHIEKGIAIFDCLFFYFTQTDMQDNRCRRHTENVHLLHLKWGWTTLYKIFAIPNLQKMKVDEFLFLYCRQLLVNTLAGRIYDSAMLSKNYEYITITHTSSIEL